MAGAGIAKKSSRWGCSFWQGMRKIHWKSCRNDGTIRSRKMHRGGGDMGKASRKMVGAGFLLPKTVHSGGDICPLVLLGKKNL